MKLIIDIPEERLDSIKHFGIKQNEVSMLERALISGTPLDDVKAEIQRTITASWYNGENYKKNYRDGLNDAIEILDNIGKAESEDKNGNNTK